MELVVVMVIIGTLVGMLLPAVQSARESARQSSCKNNLRNQGLGLLQFEASRREFPVGCDFQSGLRHAWSSFILPFIEAETISARVDYAQPCDDEASGNLAASRLTVALYVCPAGRESYPGKQDYFGMAGVGAGAEGVPVFDESETFPIRAAERSTCGMLYGTDEVRRRGARAASVTDGLSATLMVSEASDNGISLGQGIDLVAAQAFSRWSTNSSFILNTRIINKDRGEMLFSNHPRLVLCMFADGHVRAIAEGVSPTVLVAVSTRYGGENLPEF